MPEGTVQVTIRNQEFVWGLVLGEFYPEDIDLLVQLVQRHGAVVKGAECRFAATQFVSNAELGKRAYFEIVVAAKAGK